jgi:DNA-binding MarR family transcriptional regulator
MSTPTDFGLLLGLAFERFKTELHVALAERGYDDLGSAYGYVFRALASGPLHLGELAQRLGITDQGMVKIVHEMEARAYVERRPDPNDGRAKLVTLAKRGRAALASARRFHASYERRLGETLGTTQAAALRAALERLTGVTDTEMPVLRVL